MRVELGECPREAFISEYLEVGLLGAHCIHELLNSLRCRLRFTVDHIEGSGESLRPILGALHGVGVASVYRETDGQPRTDRAHHDTRAADEGTGALRADAEGL